VNSPLIAYCPLELLSEGEGLRGPSSTPVTAIDPVGSASNTVPQTWKRGTLEALASNFSLQTLPLLPFVGAMKKAILVLPVGTKCGATKKTLPSFGSCELSAEKTPPWSKMNSTPLVPSAAGGRSVTPMGGEPA